MPGTLTRCPEPLEEKQPHNFTEPPLPYSWDKVLFFITSLNMLSLELWVTDRKGFLFFLFTCS